MFISLFILFLEKLKNHLKLFIKSTNQNLYNFTYNKCISNYALNNNIKVQTFIIIRIYTYNKIYI